MMALVSRRLKARTLIWLSVAAGLLLLVAANAHLVYVAFASQPDCIDHVKRGVAVAASGQFSAASSSCTPR
ncbi:hypothetical protein RPMA_00100 [Tardiphaga alba]|uniref:Uncharacterized protein n=1 Tax=Tardiphaga alba TaxID=340268 RepID=A0ABX8A1Y4_9BRAD|nr:hypothetical protein [Tardiphaga alba]QUS37448.1 hypothetical protein RPMA_00100 [Tardiphaga alba]